MGQTDLPRVLIADCPWPHGDQLPGKGRGALKHYRSFDLPKGTKSVSKKQAAQIIDQLCDYPLPQMHRDSVCFFWRVASMQAEALRVLEAWRFRLVAEVPWVKVKRPTPKLLGLLAAGARGEIPIAEVMTAMQRAGMGRYVRNAHETCLIGVSGKASAMRLRRDIPSVIFAERTTHSAKPAAIYDLAERLFPGPYVELFARSGRPGWTTHVDPTEKRMRRMSFALTEPQLVKGLKDVTRRLGWTNAAPGQRILAVRKCMGLKKCEKQVPLAVIEVVSAKREPLKAIKRADVRREGFGDWTTRMFVDFFCKHNKCTPETEVTRVAFRLVHVFPYDFHSPGSARYRALV